LREPVKSLTGLRAIAAYAVLVAHIISWTIARKDPSLQVLSERVAYFGISLFFVLSGFVIEYNYTDSLMLEGWRGVINFLIARFARLYPLYAALFVYAFYSSRVPYLDRPDIVISHLTLTQSWIGAIRAYFPATWTISTEWFFYLAFIPLARLFAVVRRPGRALLALLALGMMGLGILFYNRGEVVWVLISIPGLLNRGDLSINVWDWVTYYSPLTRILEFFVGCLCARLHRQNLRPVPGLMAIGAIGWCVAVIAWGDQFGNDIVALLPNFIYAPAIAALILYVLGKNVLSNILSSRPLLLLGEISYSVYLMQGLIVGRIFSFIDSAVLGSLVSICAVTLISIITWLLIERPFRYLIRRLTVSAHPKLTRDISVHRSG